MINNQDIIKLVFGFKVRYLRQQKELSYQQLAKKAGMSLSYLHDIENGKKYPKGDKIMKLAEALEVEYDFLVSLKANKKLKPIIDLFTSDFFKAYPLEMFGINPAKLMELFSQETDKFNAFVSTILKMTRSYQVSQENFYKAALRSYQDMHDNYFEDLEQAVKKFRKEFKIKSKVPYTTKELEKLLEKHYGITIDRKILPKNKALKEIRSYYHPDKKLFCINQNLSSAQENFLLGRELGFQYLEIKDRPYETRIIKADSFEVLLGNFRGSYFSVALLMDENELAKDFTEMISHEKWDGQLLINLILKYDVTAEMLFQRLTNIIPHHFGINDLFFLRLHGGTDLKTFHMKKELHLSQLHNPYGNELHEHYCQRWISINIIKKLRTRLANKDLPIVDAQISKYWETDNAYLCLSFAKKNHYNNKEGFSITIGLMLNDKLKSLVGFLNDPELKVRDVNTTCERCSMPNCEARIAPPIEIELENERKEVEIELAKLRDDLS